MEFGGTWFMKQLKVVVALNGNLNLSVMSS